VHSIKFENKCKSRTFSTHFTFYFKKNEKCCTNQSKNLFMERML